MEKVIVLGSINIDFVYFVSRYPCPGESLFSKDYDIFQGGKGANQAVALAKLGVPIYMMGKVGEDILGKLVLSSLKQDGIDTKEIAKSQINSTGSASIWITDNGQNSIVVHSGANEEINEEFVIQNEKYFHKASWFLTQFEIPLQPILLALKLAKRYGLKTIIDPAPIRKLISNNIWGLVDFLLPNEVELKELTHTKNILKSIHLLKSWGVKEVIVKLGKEGAGYEDKGKLITFPAMSVGKVIDTTGAGDCFLAGFLYGMIKQKDITKAIKIALMTASYSIQKKGAAISFPKQSDIDWTRL